MNEVDIETKINGTIVALIEVHAKTINMLLEQGVIDPSATHKMIKELGETGSLPLPLNHLDECYQLARKDIAEILSDKIQREA